MDAALGRKVAITVEIAGEEVTVFLAAGTPEIWTEIEAKIDEKMPNQIDEAIKLIEKHPDLPPEQQKVILEGGVSAYHVFDRSLSSPHAVAIMKTPEFISWLFSNLVRKYPGQNTLSGDVIAAVFGAVGLQRVSDLIDKALGMGDVDEAKKNSGT